MLPTAHTRLLTLALEAGMQCRFRIKPNDDGTSEVRLRVETLSGKILGWAAPLGSARSNSAIASALNTAAAHAMERLFPEIIYFVETDDDDVRPAAGRYSATVQKLRSFR